MFCCVAETYEMLKLAFGEETACRTQKLYWISTLKLGQRGLTMLGIQEVHPRAKRIKICFKSNDIQR
jgi:hypothetical protein